MKKLIPCIFHLRFVLPFFIFLSPAVAFSQPGEYFIADRWVADLEAFATLDQQSPPPENAILFTGSSSIRFWHDRLQEDMQGLTVFGRGFGGSTMQDSVYLLDQLVVKYKPRAVVLYQGDNDIGSYDIQPRQVRDLFALFVAQLHDSLPETRVYMLAIKPSILRRNSLAQMQEANRLLEEFCARDERLTFIDVATGMLEVDGEPRPELFVDDKLHMNSLGYDLWTSVVRPVLQAKEAGFENALQD